MAETHASSDLGEACDERTQPKLDAELAGTIPGRGVRSTEGQDSAEGDSSRRWPERRRTITLYAAFIAPCTVLALSVASIARDQERRSPSAPTENPADGPPVLGPSSAATPAATAVTGPALQRIEVPPAEFLEETDDGEPGPTTRTRPKRYDTVQQAAAESCSTASIDGLSRQIIEQARCLNPNAFAPLPARPNLVLSPNVFPYLELEARDHLVRALDTHSSGKMTVNSALRTVAQQYLVSRWAAGKRCGVQLATPPGESHHEVGAALDIAEPARWRSALEEQGFRWLGSSDRVHFDYKGGSDETLVATDVRAFKVLWNRNHPEDTVTVDGHYSPAVERRLRRAPARGFLVGPTCRAGAATKRL